MSSSSTHIVDVEMKCLRRSTRVAQKLTCNNHKEEVVAKLGVRKRCSKRITKKRTPSVASRVHDKFVVISESKISDLFALVKRHSKSSEDRKTKYTILKALVKKTRQLGIANKVLDLYNNKDHIAHSLYLELNAPFLKIKEDLQDILDYPELCMLEEQEHMRKDDETIANVSALMQCMKMTLHTESNTSLEDMLGVLSKLKM